MLGIRQTCRVARCSSSSVNRSALQKSAQPSGPLLSCRYRHGESGLGSNRPR